MARMKLIATLESEADVRWHGQDSYFRKVVDPWVATEENTFKSELVSTEYVIEEMLQPIQGTGKKLMAAFYNNGFVEVFVRD